MEVRRGWERIAGMPTRWLMRIFSREHPRREYDGIRLIVADEWLIPSAERFFEQTEKALGMISVGAPQAYAALRRDLRQILLWGDTQEPPYHRFQMAAVVAPAVAFEADTRCYAAWLLYASGLPSGAREARARSEDLLMSFEAADRARVAEWLRTTERPPT